MSTTPSHAPAAPRLHALIPCAGSGSRARTAVPKQYQPVAGRAVVEHTLAAFEAVARIDTVLVVLAPGDAGLRAAGRRRVAGCGGDTRAASVRGGLQALRALGAHEDDWVLVHDAARCLITPELIDRLIDACLPDPVGGLLAQPLADTLKRADAGRRVQATVPREALWQAQTPQMFRLGVLAAALDHALDAARGAADAAVTDEASAIEAAGHRPLLVPSSPLNFKLTWPEDFALAEALLARRAASPQGTPT